MASAKRNSSEYFEVTIRLAKALLVIDSLPFQSLIKK
jgi:hypothetical protein